MMTSKSLRWRTLWKLSETCVRNGNVCTFTLLYIFMHVCLCRSLTNKKQSEVIKPRSCVRYTVAREITTKVNRFSLQTCRNNIFLLSCLLSQHGKQQWFPLLTSAFTRFCLLIWLIVFFPQGTHTGMDNINELAFRSGQS